MNRKGQLTVFILLGFVIFMSFIFVFYFAEVYHDIINEKKAEEIIEGTFDVASFRKQISFCFDQATIESLDIITQQGGYIFHNQLSSIIEDEIPVLNYFDKNISYGIYVDDATYPKSPDYPCYDSGDMKYSYPCYYRHGDKGFTFGENNPLLADSNNIPPLYKNYIQGFTFAFNYSYSVQEQLENLIMNLTLQCTNLSVYFKTFSRGISYEEPSIDLDIGKDDISGILNFPVLVNLTKERVTKNYEFSSYQKIRLRTLWETANKIIDYEIKKLDSSYDDIKFAKNISVNRFKYKNDYIISIQDQTYYIKNRPVSFQFAIKNRRPVLDCVGSCTDDERYDIIVPVNSTLVIKPYAIDPDDDAVEYYYSGWKADYDEYWPDNVSERGTQLSISANRWHNSELFLLDGECDYPTDKKVNSRGRCSKIYVTDKDIGPHEVIVYAKDSEKTAYQDYQKIKILVDTAADPVVDNVHVYKNFSKNMTSIEDPFYFNMTDTNYIFESDYYFYWTDETINKTIQTKNFTISIPQKINITNISDGFLVPGIHKVKLKVIKPSTSLVSDEKEFNLEVFKCLPYRTEIPTAPFPYNENPYDNYSDISNPFQANHVCCDNSSGSWGDYMGTDTECYFAESTVCRYVVDDNLPIPKGTLIDSSMPVWPITNALGLRTFDQLARPTFIDTGNESTIYINDIFTRSIKQFCDGKRGNVCDGNVTDEWDQIKECKMCEYCSWNSTECAKWDEGIICNTTKKCVDGFGDDKYVMFFGKRDYVAMGVCDGQGECKNTIGNKSVRNTTMNLSVYPYGVLDDSNEYIVSENCNFNDIANAIVDDTCDLDDWTCVNNGEAKCESAPGYPLTVNCNDFDNLIEVNLVDDICSWIDYGVNTSSCNIFHDKIFNTWGCSANSQDKCCMMNQQVNLTSDEFYCDELDDTNISDKRLIESEVTNKSCVIGNTRDMSCEIVDVTCSASNMCRKFSDFANFTLDEVEDHLCIYKNPFVGYTWTKNYTDTELYCTDGNDNDCDGLIDCDDPDCMGKQCQYVGVTGVCVNNSDVGFCEINEVCNESNGNFVSNCYQCGASDVHGCIDNASETFGYNGMCAFSTGPIICETGSVCLNNITGGYYSGCSQCNMGDLCDDTMNGYFDPDGVCTTDGNCCDLTSTDMVRNGIDFYCGCDTAYNNFECEQAINNSDFLTFNLYGHCQENNCCKESVECFDDCSNVTCDQDTDCSIYVNSTSGICYYGNVLSGYGDCSENCKCEYVESNVEDFFYGLNLSFPCEYGDLYGGYCLKNDLCLHNCSCGDSGWSCGVEDCPEPGTSKEDVCYYETLLERSNDCTENFGCSLSIDTEPDDFVWNECSEYDYNESYYCYVNMTTVCYYNDINSACDEQNGWKFNSEFCPALGTKIDDNCWFGENVCNSTGCQSQVTTTKPNNCTYFYGTCPGKTCSYHFNLQGEKCDPNGGWQCYNSNLDSNGESCADYDFDGICNDFETDPCEKGEYLDECKHGFVSYINQTNFDQSSSTIIKVNITNSGVDGNIIVRPTVVPSGVSVSNNLWGKTIYINTNSTESVEFAITTSTSGSYQIYWEIDYDNIWPISNKNIDFFEYNIVVS